LKSNLRNPNLVNEQRKVAFIVTLILFITGLALTLDFSFHPAYSDSMSGSALSQRIGSFDVELKTMPSTPVAGDRTNIFLRIGTIDGNDAIDTPITIRVAKQGEEVHKSNIIFIPNGHYTYPYRFAESGIYGIYILIHDSSAIGQSRTSSISSSSYPMSSQGQDILFTFPLNVDSRSLLEISGIQLVMILASTAAVSAIIIFYLRIKKNHGEQSFRPTRFT
jgi:hypothetical protein